MKIIWALYDDGNCSYKKAIEQNFNGLYEVHCIGINEPPFEDTQFYKYHKIDLSITNNNLIKQLEKLPHPNIILASPPCESWSIANPIQSYKPQTLILNNRRFFDECNSEFNYRSQRDFFRQQTTRILGETTQLATIKIIEHFKPEKWVIENPANSRCWLYQRDFLNFYGYENKTYYNCYNYPAKKPTIFKSNIEMSLRDENIKGAVKLEDLNSYDCRSAIPNELIKDIISQLEKPIEQQLNLLVEW